MAILGASAEKFVIYENSIREEYSFVPDEALNLGRKIAICKQLSEEFIREFKKEVGWNGISHKQKLLSEFIREFVNRLDWHYISTYQRLSEKFIEEFRSKLIINQITKCYFNMKDWKGFL